MNDQVLSAITSDFSYAAPEKKKTPMGLLAGNQTPVVLSMIGKIRCIYYSQIRQLQLNLTEVNKLGM